MSEAQSPSLRSREPNFSDEEKASGPMRALAVVVSLLLAFGVAVMVIVAINPDNIPLCDDVESGKAALGPTSECIDSSRALYTASRIGAGASALVGGLAVLLGLYVAATGRRGALMVRLTIVALALGGLTVLIDYI